MWRPKRKTRKELFAEAKAAEDDYNRNRHDPQKLKSWISSLANAVINFHDGDYMPDIPLLYAAKSKLEKILEIEKDDLCTMFELGCLCCTILHWDTDHHRYTEAYKPVYYQAVAIFQEVQLKAPPGLYETSSMLEALKCIEPLEFSEITYDYAWEENVDSGGAASVRCYKEVCKDAEALFSTNPENFRNLNMWGDALAGLAYYSVDPIQKLKYTEEAKNKFQAASLLEPGNIYNNRDLVKAKLDMCRYRTGNDYSELKASYTKLAEEAEEESKKRKRDF